MAEKHDMTDLIVELLFASNDNDALKEMYDEIVEVAAQDDNMPLVLRSRKMKKKFEELWNG